VLVDGRSLYNRAFSGAGNFERDSGAIRYGGSVGAVDYRVYSQWSDRAAGLTDARTPANDSWNALTTGVRADWSRGPDSIMAEGSFMDTQARPGWTKMDAFFAPSSNDGVSDLDEATALGRWTHHGSNGSQFQVQAFRTYAHRDESTLWQLERTGDVDVQYQTKIGSRHGIVTGGGYRDSDLETVKSFTTDIPSDETAVFNAFVQDEVSVNRAVKVTLGSKVEHQTFAGWGLLPSARIMWNVDPSHQRAWASVSRARRTPGAAYRGLQIYAGAIPGENGVPIVFRTVGNPDARPEQLLELEGGYRTGGLRSAGPTIAVARGDAASPAPLRAPRAAAARGTRLRRARCARLSRLCGCVETSTQFLFRAA